MKLLLLLTIGCMLSLACAPANRPEQPEPSDPDHPAPRSFLALGDSYTIGEAVPEEDRWPSQLTRALAEIGIDMRDPEIIARTGWTTTELKTAIDERKPSTTYDLVSLQIGVNNQYRSMDIDVFVREFKELLEIAIELAGNRPDRVFVVSIPDWGVTPFAEGRDRKQIATEIDAYNRIKRAACAGRGVTYFEITDISRMVPEQDGLVASDGLHPSAVMYAAWVQRLAPGVMNLLNGDGPDGR